jgi:3-oxoacyl-[acyl-carrier-protein] synthase-3
MYEFGLGGTAQALGSRTISNADVSQTLGKPETWLEDHTGIVSRRVCEEGEDAVTLACAAIEQACAAADVHPGSLGPETILVHIQNGPVNLTPPSGVTVAQALGLGPTRVVAIDGVCAEPLVALDIVGSLMTTGRCERAIVSAAANFLPIISPQDAGTTGLFGAGAGAMVLDRAPSGLGLKVHGLRWETHAVHGHLGRIPINGYEVVDDGIKISAGYYEMDGPGLAKAALRVLPNLLDACLEDAGWNRDELDLVVAHQPNAKLLELGARMLRIDVAKLPMPVREIGNLGPASMLVTLALEVASGRVASGARLLLMGFGLGLSCGVAAIEVR